MANADKCPKCGAPLDERAQFCQYCGEKIARTSGTIQFDYHALLQKMQEIDAETAPIVNQGFGITAVDPYHESKQTAKKASLVSTCPLPKGSDELFEFAEICASNALVKPPAHGIAESAYIHLQEAWKQKGLSAIGMLKVAAAQDPMLSKQAELLEEQLKAIKKPMTGTTKTLIICGAAMAIGIIAMVIGAISGG